LFFSYAFLPRWRRANFADLASQPRYLILLQPHPLDYDLSLVSARLQSLDFNS
jgi:hypothetical protein